MRIVRSVLLCGLTGASFGAMAQTPPTDAAAAVLAATRTALGGEKKIAAVKSLVATGRTRQVRGDNLVPIEFEIAMELPDRYVRRDEIPAQESGPTSTGFNTGELIQFPAPAPPNMAGRAGAPPPTAEQMDAARRTRLSGVKQDFVRLTLGMFADSFSSVPLTFSYVAKAEAPQGKADVLAVKGPDNFTARFFVSENTHLPIMVTWTAPPPPQRGGGGRGGPARGDAPPARESGPATPERGGGPAREGPPSRGDMPPASAGQAGRGGPASAPPESRLYYADYREVSGLQLPFRLRRAVGADTVEETTFDGFKINPKIDPKKFEVRR
jgi:hypothetical protein